MKVYGFLNEENIIVKIMLTNKVYEKTVELPYFNNDFLGAKFVNGEVMKEVIRNEDNI